MSNIKDFEAALVTIDGAVVKIKVDVEGLRAKLNAIPSGGLTPEQQAGIDGAVVHAEKIAVALGAIDATVNPTTPPIVPPGPPSPHP